MPSGRNAATAVKLVVDTNTLISGSLWPGPPSQLLNAALTGRIKLFVSAEILLEFSEVLQRPHLAARLAAAGETAAGITARFRNACHVVAPLPLSVPEDLRDPDDVHVLACALAAEADLIVTGDKDLLVLGTFQGIPIVKAAEAVAMISKLLDS